MMGKDYFEDWKLMVEEVASLKAEVARLENDIEVRKTTARCRSKSLKQAEAEVDHQKERKASIGKEVDKWRNRAVAHQADNAKLREALTTSNDLCRSAMSIAKRQGKSVNWSAFETKLESSLLFQHKKMIEVGMLDGRSNKRKEVQQALKERDDE